jgi:adenylosuccinate synthase
MRQVDVILGLQWGDEGKGKVVDVLTPDYKVICRFQGGPNAGHSLVFQGTKFVLHTVPSGIFRDDSINVIGNGLVIDPIVLAKEVSDIEAKGVDVQSKIFLSKKAHLILPTHRILDAASEASKGENKIGSTLRGIGPTYRDKIGRSGLRIGDIIRSDFQAKYNALKEFHLSQLRLYDFKFDIEASEKEWFEAVEALKRLKIVDSEYLMNKYIKDGVKILAEGAQGALLDIEFGNYPFVTSSNTLASGVCVGLGIPPTTIGKVFGIFKAYCTRVGGGPFPTELFDETGTKLRTVGQEFGATTGRARRVGWLDMVALKYSIMMSDVTSLIMMKSDVLDDFEEIKVCTGYEIDGQVVQDFPYDLNDGVTPVYTSFKGWKTSLKSIRKYDDFPGDFKKYVEFIEKDTGVPISIISIGPDREETIIR